MKKTTRQLSPAEAKSCKSGTPYCACGNKATHVVITNFYPGAEGRDYYCVRHVPAK